MLSWPSIPHALWIFISTIMVTLIGSVDVLHFVQAGKDDVPRRLAQIDIDRIRELHRITDELGEQIWPGFDTRKIPVAVNGDDQEELLIGHGNPPAEFHPFAEYQVNGQPVLIREGVTRYGPRGGGWAIELGGAQTAYVGALAAERDTDSYLALILHECFHCFQRDYRERADNAAGDLPEDDPRYSSLLGLESRALRAALDATDPAETRKLVGMFVAIRHERRQGLPPNLIALEGEKEYNEGTATYSAVRMYQLLAEKGGMPRTDSDTAPDPQYRYFVTAQTEFDHALAQIIPPADQPITFFHSMYQHGMAQCLLLDRLRPTWKVEIKEKGMTQFALLEKELALDEQIQAHLLNEAQTQFEYASLLAGQTKLVEERLNLIRGLIAPTGRRYRIYHGELPGAFNWKPMGPVYHVPASLELELNAKNGEPQAQQQSFRRTVWVKGIRRFEKGSLVFESTDTPVIFGRVYLEWIDTTPATDASDMIINSDTKDGEILTGVYVCTDGFTLKVDRARVIWSPAVVEIHLPH